jgi:hypothetical protein
LKSELFVPHTFGNTSFDQKVEMMGPLSLTSLDFLGDFLFSIVFWSKSLVNIFKEKLN